MTANGTKLRVVDRQGDYYLIMSFINALPSLIFWLFFICSDLFLKRVDPLVVSFKI